MTEDDAMRYLLWHPHGPFSPDVWELVKHVFVRSEYNPADDPIERMIADAGKAEVVVTSVIVIRRTVSTPTLRDDGTTEPGN